MDWQGSCRCEGFWWGYFSFGGGREGRWTGDGRDGSTGCGGELLYFGVVGWSRSGPMSRGVKRSHIGEGGGRRNSVSGGGGGGNRGAVGGPTG